MTPRPSTPTLLRLLLLTVPIWALACGEDVGTSLVGPEEGSVSPEDGSLPGSTMSIAPDRASADALESRVEFQATVSSAGGNLARGARVTWSSLNPDVAGIDEDGRATARTNGEARIVARAGAAADTAVLTVDQAVDSLAVSPAVVSLEGPGDTARLDVRAWDGRGHLVAGASVAWTSSSDSVATVDSGGVVRARTEGDANIIASAEGAADTTDVSVGPDRRQPPSIGAVGPSPLPEGGEVVISGANFVPDAPGIGVSIDGVEASVTVVSPIRLEVTVPSFDCRPARDVAVEVRTAAGNDTTTARLAPDEVPISLGIGEQRLVEDPDDFCLQFGDSGVSTAYLVGVQSTSETEGVTPVLASSEAAGQVAPAILAPVVASRSGDAGRSLPTEWQRRHRDRTEAELRLRAWERQRLPELARQAGTEWQPEDGGPTVQASRADRVEVGDTIHLRVPDILSNACRRYSPIEAEVRVVGDAGVWVTDLDNPGTGAYTTEEIRELSDRFDSSIYPTEKAYFGRPTDKDRNDRGIFVITKEVNRLGGILGFVGSPDLVSRSLCPSSDEGELTYLIAPDPNGSMGPAYDKQELFEDASRLVAHEFAHVIQLGRRLERRQSLPATWMLEGQANFAEEVVGHAVTGRSTGRDYGGDVAFDRGGGDGTDWYETRFLDLAHYFGLNASSSKVGRAPESCTWLVRGWGSGAPCTGTRSVYGTPSSFLRWLSDHFAASHPGGEQGIHRELIDSGRVGFENLESVLGESVDRLLAEWAAALYVDGRVQEAGPRLTFPSWDMADVFGALVPSARLRPYDWPFATSSDTLEVNAASTAYLRLSGSRQPATAVSFRSPSGQSLPSETQVWVVRLQ